MPKVLDEKAASRVGDISLVTKNQFVSAQTKFSRTYYVLADTTSDEEETIRTTTGIPPLLSKVSGAWCVCKKVKEVAPVRHPTTGAQAALFEVTCDFDSDINVNEADQSPEAHTPKVIWHGDNEEELLERDPITGAAIVTVPGEQIIATHPVVRPVLEVKRYEIPPFDPTIIFDYCNRVNDSSFYGAPVGTALMMAVEASEEKVIAETTVIEVTYRVKFNLKLTGGAFEAETWKLRPLHEGTLYFPTTSDPAEVYTDKYGKEIVINLAADGTKLGDGADPVFLEFNRYGRANFNLLNLGPF